MLKQLLENLSMQVCEVQNLHDLHKLKSQMLGKQSIFQQEVQKLGKLSAEEKRKFGMELNESKLKIESLLNDKQVLIEEAELQRKIQSEKIDLTLPVRHYKNGSIHPITECLSELVTIFAKLGFEMKTGPSIEDDWHNFTSLNIDENHPARQMHDTFYLHAKKDEKNLLLRTHTSNTQIRTMSQGQPPFCFIAPGRTYRSDSDMTHTPMFHQIEGLMVDKNIHMGHLKYIVIEFIKKFFEKPDIEIRFRPSFFPFTEPSAEVDIRMNKTDKWLEVMGCGMIHPNVLKNVNIDSEIYKGFAFGLGLERFAMLKYNIKDLRQFFEGDIRWINHYNKIIF
jgi:phenylalanyl-tRNA synthetase alpha chain